MNKIICGITLAMLSINASADWIKKLEDPTFGSFYEESTNFKIPGDTLHAKYLMNANTVQTGDKPDQQFWSVTYEYEFKCASAQVRNVETSFFSGKMGKGKVVMSETSDWYDARTIPHTLALWSEGCKMHIQKQ